LFVFRGSIIDFPNKKAHTAEFRKTQKKCMELPAHLGNPPSVETEPAEAVEARPQ
jgi:hypothetical protein